MRLTSFGSIHEEERLRQQLAAASRQIRNMNANSIEWRKCYNALYDRYAQLSVQLTALQIARNIELSREEPLTPPPITGGQDV